MRKNRTIADCVAGVKVMAKVMKGEKMEVKKARKPRAVETHKREMGEKLLERQIIFTLSTQGYHVVKAGEQATYNSRYIMEGMSDLIVFLDRRGCIFMECKQEKYRNTKDGGLRTSQVKFRELCKMCHVEHCVVYNVNEALKAVQSIKADQGSSVSENLSRP
jgi:hypothetical protein